MESPSRIVCARVVGRTFEGESRARSSRDIFLHARPRALLVRARVPLRGRGGDVKEEEEEEARKKVSNDSCLR